MSIEAEFEALNKECQWWEMKPYYLSSGAKAGYNIVLRTFDDMFTSRYFNGASTVLETVRMARAWLAEHPEAMKTPTTKAPTRTPVKKAASAPVVPVKKMMRRG